MCVLFFFFIDYTQKVYFFPLKPKLRALLSTKKYWKMCQHEFERPRNSNFITDVYDGTAWKQFMGPCNYPNDRLGFVMCIDGIPAFAAGTKSLIPWVWRNDSLPPTQRVQLKNIILYMLLDDSIKYEKQRKYFDFAVDYELHELYQDGLDGVRVKVFCSSLDIKGKEEMSGMFVCSEIIIIIIVVLMLIAGLY